jgi:hypothetical protein
MPSVPAVTAASCESGVSQVRVSRHKYEDRKAALKAKLGGHKKSPGAGWPAQTGAS